MNDTKDGIIQALKTSQLDLRATIRGMQQEHDRLIGMGREVERELAAAEGHLELCRRFGVRFLDERDAAQRALKSVEWNGEIAGSATCPSCGSVEGEPHREGCLLWSIISPKGGT